MFADSAKHPCLPDPTADFVYARLQDARDAVDAGYTDAELDRFGDMARAWARGEAPAGLNYAGPPPKRSGVRDVFVFMINGAKVRAPAAARALMARL